MAHYRLVLYPDEVLRKEAHSVKEIDGAVHDLIRGMREIMYKNNGIGLAAPQVGFLERIVIGDIGDGFFALINPEIIEGDGKANRDEGCLSLPEIRVEVPRKTKIWVRAWTLEGKEIEREFSGLTARVIQHEVDHLNGRLIIDYATTGQRLKFQDKLERLEKMYKFKTL